VEEVLDVVFEREQFERVEGKRNVGEQDRLRVRYTDREVLCAKIGKILTEWMKECVRSIH
jgi:hypothetical protein